MEVDDAAAIYDMGCYYYNGSRGLPQDHAKALELWHQAAKLGYAPSYYSIGAAFNRGVGVERDEKKAMHYFELAAMGGVVEARYNCIASAAHYGELPYLCSRESLHYISRTLCNIM